MDKLVQNHFPLAGSLTIPVIRVSVKKIQWMFHMHGKIRRFLHLS